MSKYVEEVRLQLRYMADPAVALSSRRFFKDDQEARLYGLRSAEVAKIAKRAFKEVGKCSKPEIWGMCEELWQSGYQEEHGVACLWSHALAGDYTPDDFTVFERWVTDYVKNWASCDTLCNHTVGDFLITYPQFIDNLKDWAGANHRWLKRAAAVSLIIPARKGMFLDDIFMIADKLLPDEDDMVQKGYGWMLKAASEAHLQPVFDYVLSKKAVMPRTALRYALEKMPKDLKTRAMGKG